jgi:hypothetical protein
VVWHFYQVFLDPDVYPMNWAWWDGKMSFEHYREEHGLDSQTLLAASQGEIDAKGPAVGSEGAEAPPRQDRPGKSGVPGEIVPTDQ